MLLRMMAGKNFIQNGQNSVTIKNGLESFKQVQSKLQKLEAKAAAVDPKSTKATVKYELNDQKIELALQHNGSEYQTKVTTNNAELLGDICSEFPHDFIVK